MKTEDCSQLRTQDQNRVVSRCSEGRLFPLELRFKQQDPTMGPLKLERTVLSAAVLYVLLITSTADHYSFLTLKVPNMDSFIRLLPETLIFLKPPENVGGSKNIKAVISSNL